MQRSLASRFGAFTLTAGLLAAAACSRTSGTGQGTPPTQGEAPVVPPELEGYVQELATKCEAITDDTTTEASLRDARAAYRRGELDIPLSPKGCLRLFVRRSGDRETFSAVLSPPFGIKFDPTTGTVTRTASMVSWSTSADGKQRVRGDLDADGIDELEESVIPDVSVTSERRTPEGVVERTTAKVAEGKKRLEITEEAERDGTFGVVTKYEGARVAHKCSTDPPPGTPPPPSTPPRPPSPFPEPPHEVTCTAEQRQKLETLLEKATNGGATCLEGTGQNDLRFRLLRQMATTSFDFKCTDTTDFIAANDSGYGNVFPGRALIWINPMLFGAVEAEQVATLYHELLHFFFAHDHDVEALADNGSNLAYADRVYACEQLCFAKKPNTCHLAACTKKKICNVDRSGFERKTGKELESCWSGHQVGAVCRKGVGARQWCTTKAECDAACGGQECESKSISCNESCR
jgi:hypothetical protein